MSRLGRFPWGTPPCRRVLSYFSGLTRVDPYAEDVMHPIDQPSILVTGATDGLGKALARELAARGATVLLHGRSAERLAQAMHEIREVTGSERLRTYRADLASLDAVRGLAADIERDHDRLDVLVNNAAIGGGRPGSGRELSADGHELRFAVNFLAPFVLAERLRGTAVTVNALHPASLMNTKMVYESFGYTLSTIEDGLEATLPLVIGPALEGVSGRYFDRLREARAHKQAYDPEARHRLWRMSEQLAGLASLPTVPQG